MRGRDILLRGAARPSLTAQVQALFAGGKVGGMWDMGDTATLFQEHYGATSVAAVTQTIGMVLDKSQGLVIGSEMVTNGGPSFGNTVGWLAYGTGSNFSVVGGNLVAVDDCYFPLTGLTVGKTYEVRYEIVSAPGAGLNLYEDANSAGPAYVLNLKGAGIYRVRVTKTELGIYLSHGVTLASISVRELPGNHATQPTAGPSAV